MHFDKVWYPVECNILGLEDAIAEIKRQRCRRCQQRGSRRHHKTKITRITGEVGIHPEARVRGF